MLGLLKRSVATKAIVYVGSAMVLLFMIHSYINISKFNELASPSIGRNLDNALARSQLIFDNIYQQTLEDAKIIQAHNALSNYLDYEQIGDQQGLNEEQVTLEQFLTSLAATKPHYQDIEILTSDGSVIRVENGQVAMTNDEDYLRSISTDNPSQYQAFFSAKAQDQLQDSHLIQLIPYFNLSYHFAAENDFIDGQGSKVVIRIVNQVSGPVKELIASLKAINLELTVTANGSLIAGPSHVNTLSNNIWLTQHIEKQRYGLDIAVSIKRSDAFVLINEMQRSMILLAISIVLVLTFSQFFTIRQIIAKPLRNIIEFMHNNGVNQGQKLVHYETSSEDEIGVFAKGLNSLLEQNQQRQTALKSSEERLALALWGSGEGLWEYRLDPQSVYFDKMSCEILGLQENELEIPLTTFIEKVHIDDKEQVAQNFKSFGSHTEQLFETEFRFASHEQYIWLQLRAKLTIDVSQKMARSLLVGTCRDISEQRASQQQVRLYAKAFDSSVSAILILDRSLKVLAANDAYQKITGFSFNEIKGRVPSFIVDHHSSTFNLTDFTRRIENLSHWQSELIGIKANKERFVKDINIDAVYDTNDQLSHYVCAFADITTKKKSEEDLWQMANHDILTGIPNRGFFRKSLQKILDHAATDKQFVALMFLDLDRFKQVNDRLGHEVGDELLKKVARILVQSARRSDHVARLGGDEFAIILDGVSRKTQVTRVVKNLLKSFEDGLMLDDKNSGVGLSIGISLYPQDSTNADELVHFADTAMYVSKTTGTNLYHFFEPNMSDHVNRRNLLENELRKALEQDTLTHYYQPQMDVTSGRIVCFEALSRWFHPELGVISPDEFIPIAEDSGLIVPLGKLALTQACKQLKAWHQQGFNDIKVAINVSAKQFLLTDIAFDVTTIINELQIDAKFIELELTESLIVDDPEKVIGMLHKLKAIGVNLSIDDFGTGYSSLSYLNRFPLDVLKIDKSFINQLGSDQKGLAITQSIIAIAQALHLEIIAEGVETEEQLDLLQKLGCKYVQGYYFSRPISAEETFIYILDHNQAIV